MTTPVIRMVAIPKEIIDMAGQNTTTKLLVTVSPEGQPHAIVCGSIFITPDGVAGVGEILMKRSAQYLKDSGKASLEIISGQKAFELILKNAKRADSGECYEDMKSKMASLNLPCFAVWTFDISEIWDESAGPNAGKKIA